MGAVSKDNRRAVMRKERAGGQILFLVGSCVLGYEIVLTRAASAFFQYHFAFLVLSLAMFSLFASGVVYQRLTEQTSERAVGRAGGTLFLLLACSPVLFYPAAPILWRQTGLVTFGFAVLFCGSFIALHYLRRAEDTGYMA